MRNEKKERMKDVEPEVNYRGFVKRVLVIFEVKLSFGPKCLAAAETVNSAAVQEQQVLEGIICPTRTTG
jgi:hypothetical protein